MSDLIINVYSAFFTLFNAILSVILSPLDLLLESVIPIYSSMSTYVANFFNYFEDIFYFVIGWLNIPPVAIDLILGYIAFRVAIFFGTMAFKLFVRWYNALKV